MNESKIFYDIHRIVSRHAAENSVIRRPQMCQQSIKQLAVLHQFCTEFFFHGLDKFSDYDLERQPLVHNFAEIFFILQTARNKK